MPPTIIPLPGDRSAFNVNDFPGVHASDLLANAPKYHVPLPTVSGNILVADGTKWVSQAPIPIMTLGTVEGDVAVAASPFKIYNLFSANRSITKVFLSVSEAPTGADLIVDVKVGGVSIFTGGNNPKIIDGAVTGYSVTIATPTWATNSYLTWEVTQVGSTIAGANLVVHIIHGGS